LTRRAERGSVRRVALTPDQRRALSLAVFAVLALVLWRTPVLFPLRCFVVLVHEAGHALAALLTGAEVVQLVVNPDESGHVIYRGGSVIITSSAGYVGSSLLGGALLALTPKPRSHRAAVGVLGVLLVALTAVYVPFSNPFGAVLGLLWGFGLLHVALKGYSWLPTAVAGLAVMLCIYAIYDFADFLLGDASRTDAGILAGALGLPFLALPIGLLWVALSLWIMWQGARIALRGAWSRSTARRR
jgi:hypothetical protein